ncbi:MAG: M48 family metalloprotease [Solirubrobacteraceae bacterium]
MPARGKIVVHTGIQPLTRNDAGLATVFGHEVAHATSEHVAERLEHHATPAYACQRKADAAQTAVRRRGASVACS